jgi:hypothetical protein
MRRLSLKQVRGTYTSTPCACFKSFAFSCSQFRLRGSRCLPVHVSHPAWKLRCLPLKSPCHPLPGWPWVRRFLHPVDGWYNKGPMVSPLHEWPTSYHLCRPPKSSQLQVDFRDSLPMLGQGYVGVHLQLLLRLRVVIAKILTLIQKLDHICCLNYEWYALPNTFSEVFNYDQ